MADKKSTPSNKFALFTGYLHSDRFDTYEDAEAQAHKLLAKSPQDAVTVLEIHAVFTGEVTVKPAE